MRGPQRMKPTDFDDPLTLHLVPSQGLYHRLQKNIHITPNTHILPLFATDICLISSGNSICASMEVLF